MSTRTCYRVWSPAPSGSRPPPPPVPGPAIVNLSPSSVTEGGPAFTLLVNGSGFVPGAQVEIDGVVYPTDFISPNQLSVAVPSDVIAMAGQLSVQVIQPGGISNTSSLDVLPAPPVIISIAPDSAAAGSPATTVLITGSGFTSDTVVYIGGLPIPTIYLSPSQLFATIPASHLVAPGLVTLTAINSAGSSAPFDFTVTALPAPPVLDSISPASVTAGGPSFTLTATGSNFTPSTVLYADGLPLVTNYVSPTEVTAEVPAGTIATAGPVPIQAINDEGSSAILNLDVTPALPVITSLIPSVIEEGSPDTPLTVIGTDFTLGSTINLDGVPISTAFVSPTEVTGVIPAASLVTPGVIGVTVTTVAGTSAPASLTISAIPPPVITSLAPSSVMAGSPDTMITVTGTGFDPSSVVNVDGIAVATTYVSPTELTAVIPASMLATDGIREITVTAAGGTSAGANLTVTPVPPEIVSVSPATIVSGSPDTVVTIIGTEFTPTAVVNLGGLPVATTYISPTELEAIVPAAAIAAPGNISLTVTVGSETSLPFDVPVVLPPPPTITLVNPPSFVAGSGDTLVTVTGTDFTPDSFITIDGTPVATTYIDANTLSATVDSSYLSLPGTLGIGVTSPGGTAPDVPIPIVPPPGIPTISSITPTSAPFGAPDTPIVVIGTDFTPDAVVEFDGVPLTTTVVSPTEINATIPSSYLGVVGPASVTVTTVAGTSAPVVFHVLPLAAIRPSLQ
jgi:hypothetical protein